MTPPDLVFWTAFTGVLSALTTGLGAFPVALVRCHTARWKALSGAGAAGMMISASMFSLADKGLSMRADHPGAPYEVIAGLLVGTWFIWSVGQRLEDGELFPAPLGTSRRGMLFFVAMLVHSFPEGVAIGVGFATGDPGFGLLMAAAISVHNIPEGIAIALPLRGEGAGLGRCALLAVTSSLPQPLMAVPSALMAWLFEPLLAGGLGFAGGAMMYLAVAELIPEAVADGGKTLAAWGVMLGLAAMLLATVFLEGLT